MREFDRALKDLKAKNLLRNLTTLDSSRNSKAYISINNHRYINFSSNDYLGLSGHSVIVQSAIKYLKKYGLGSGASRLLSGSFTPHKGLEERIAKFKNTESALVFNTGYSANTGIIPSIAGPGDIIFSDEFNHASIVDGARLSRAEIKVYGHRDTNHLESLLKRFKTSKRKLVITDTVFSMDGDIAPLKKITALCRRYSALLIIDDAHATGVIGKTGRGGLEHFGIDGKDIIQMGTLSKAFGCFGGFAAGSKEFISLLINRARSFIYSTSLPPVIAEACIKAIDIVDTGSSKRRKKLWDNRQRLYRGLVLLNFDTLHSETPIVPVLAGDIKRAVKIGNYLFKHKIFAPAIRPPTVPEDKCRIRFSVTSEHTYKDIDKVLDVLEKYKISSNSKS